MQIYKTRDVKTPVRGTEGSAGLDFYVPNDIEINNININNKVFLGPGEDLNIPSGIHAKIPHGFALIAFNKSGKALNKGLQVGACVIDEDYQGEIHLHIRNTSTVATWIEPGEKLVQFLCIPVEYIGVEEVNSLETLFGSEETERGAGGFGSTDKK